MERKAKEFMEDRRARERERLSAVIGTGKYTTPVHDQAGGGLGGVDVSHPIPLVSGANPVSPKLHVRKAKRGGSKHSRWGCRLRSGNQK